MSSIIFTIETVKRFHENYRVLGNGCWEWKGYTDKALSNYPKIRITQENRMKAHRFSWILHHGPIPIKYQIHHKCEYFRCVNPLHLEPTTHKRHMRDLTPSHWAYKKSRMTHCFQGHEFTKENTFIKKNGTRRCVICLKVSRRNRERRYIKRHKEKILQKNRRAYARRKIRRMSVQTEYGIFSALYNASMWT